MLFKSFEALTVKANFTRTSLAVWNYSCTRTLYSESKHWDQKYKKETRIALENYWKKRLSKRWKEKLKAISTSTVGKEKFYCLSMFPYPSGRLHMGHVRVYTISDAMAHYHRMRGKEVVHPMGWDSFGLPAENAAIVNGLNPAEWTDSNIAYMKQQLDDLNLFFNWDRELSTCSPEYYRWTQFLFLKLFEAGLAYRKKALVNWDPVDKTVLAEEQVDDEGRSWRSGAIIEKKSLKQWFLRTTTYAKSLLDTLHEVEENVGIKSMQSHWIGDIDGCSVLVDIEVDGVKLDEAITVFCSHPELLTHASHINLHTDHNEENEAIFRDAGVDTSVLDMSKEGTMLNIYGINPLTGARVPFVVSNHHAEKYQSSNIMGLPNINAKDAQIALKHHLVINHNQVAMNRTEALAKIKQLQRGQGCMTSSGLRDWLISRQRRWGTPIPIVYCPEHGAVPVAEDDLPVLLPGHKEDLNEWKKTTCPICGNPAQRETDTMDTFVDSAWYFFRFTDPNNSNKIFSKDICNRMMPVDLYIGGKEHAILHLYYARFISHFCADIGLTSHREPFKKILAQGIIKGKTYRLKSSGKYLSPSDVDDGVNTTEKSTGAEVEASFEKMSKSKLNGVDPQQFVSEWGINLTRLFVLYAAAPREVIHWDVKTDVIPGVMRWQMKLWRLVGRLLEAREKSAREVEDVDSEFKLALTTNRTIEKVTNLFETSCTLSAAITSLMTLARYTVNLSENIVECSPEFERSVCAQVIMSAPLMPHFASELWTGLCGMKYKLTDHKWNEEVLDQSWPHLSENLKSREIQVRVNQHYVKLRVAHGVTTQDEIKKEALKHPKVFKRLKGAMIVEEIIGENTITFVTRKKEAI